MKRAAFVVSLAGAAATVRFARAASVETTAAFAALERAHGGHLGVAAIGSIGDWNVAHRGDERFAMCSTFKLPLVAGVLARVDARREELNRVVHYGRSDMMHYAPVTSEHLAQGGMTVGALCAAAIEFSDNTAANLLFGIVGGPPGLTRYVRGLGDGVTRFDRMEPALNTAIAGDPRDTSTPDAMSALVRKLLCGNALGAASRKRLIGWLDASQTGFARIRAGVPHGWRVGDKTGTGDNGATNDVAIVTPAQRPPFLLTVYYVGSPATGAQREAVVASAARIVAGALPA